MIKLIELSGPASSGKTTLAKDVVKSLQKNGLKAYFILEAIREFKEIDFNKMNTDDAYNQTYQMAILAKQIRNILNSIRDNDIIICDRSLYDFYIYTKIYSNNPIFVDSFKSLIDSMYEFVIPKNRLLVKLNALELEDDGFRNMKIRDVEIREFDELNTYRTVRIDTIDREQRIHDLRNLIL